MHNKRTYAVGINPFHALYDNVLDMEMNAVGAIRSDHPRAKLQNAIRC